MIANDMLIEFKEIILPYVMEKNLLDNIHANTRLLDDLKINSAQIIDIVLDIEDKFGIRIDDHAIGRMQTVESSIAVIREKLALA